MAKKRILTACLCMLAVSVCTPPAGAELIIIGITGEVTTVADWDGFLGGAVQEGDIITGTYTYDTSTPDSVGGGGKDDTSTIRRLSASR